MFGKLILGILCFTLALAASAADFEFGKPNFKFTFDDMGKYVYVEKYGQSGQIVQVEPSLVVAFGSGSLGAQKISAYDDGFVHAQVESVKWGKRLIQAGQDWTLQDSRKGTVKRIFGTEFVEVEIPQAVEGSDAIPEVVVVDLFRLPPPALMPSSLEYPEDPDDETDYNSGIISAEGLDPAEAQIERANKAFELRNKQRQEDRSKYSAAIANLKTEAQAQAAQQERPYERYQSSHFSDLGVLIDEIEADIRLQPNVVIDLIYDPEKSSSGFWDVLKIAEYLSHTPDIKAHGSATLYLSPVPDDWNGGSAGVATSSILTHASICGRLYEAVAP